ncbi:MULTISPECIES: hypothetical protein [unclassified Mesorhizobium]|nr:MULTISPECIES: hypothetical protein [unclassified Mesorhizobium]
MTGAPGAYKSMDRGSDEVALTADIIVLARQYGRYTYRASP